MRRLFITLFLLTVVFPEHDAAKILAVFFTPSISHQVVFRPLTQELARRGHEVTVITTDPVFTKDNSPANLIEIDVHDISYKIWRDAIIQNEFVFGEKASLYQQVDVARRLLRMVAEVQMKTEEVQYLINNKNNTTYDLLILEENAKPYLILSHIFKTPVILISSLGLMPEAIQKLGAPEQIFLYPTIMQQRLYNLTFWENLEEIYKHFWIWHRWNLCDAEEFKMTQKLLGYNLPSYSELNENIDMMFHFINPLWNNNRPLPPNVISIWGIHKNPEKEIPQDLQSYLDASTNGVIYLSFGSNAPSSGLPIKTIQLLVNVFSKLPYNILWKWELDELPGKSKNIRISKWLPQADLLRHPNIKLFITQGGLQSTDEAINAGVPLIGIPMFVDQWYNVELYEYHRIGVRLEFETLSEDNLDKAIKTVISDKSYRENIIRLGTLMKDQSSTALERAVWWSEYVLRHRGAKHLRAHASNMPWTEYYEIQLLTILATIILFVFMIAIYTLCVLLRCIVPKTKIKVS